MSFFATPLWVRNFFFFLSIQSNLNSHSASQTKGASFACRCLYTMENSVSLQWHKGQDPRVAREDIRRLGLRDQQLLPGLGVSHFQEKLFSVLDSSWPLCLGTSSFWDFPSPPQKPALVKDRGCG